MGSELTPYQVQYKSWENLLERAQPKLADLLPDTIPPARLCRMLLNQMTKGSALMKCSIPSVLGAMMESAQMGLEIATGGQCWIVPFAGKATLIVGYRGFIDLMYRTGQIQLAQAVVVRVNDEFEFTRDWGGGMMPKIHHPHNEDDVATRGHLRGAYFAGLLKGATIPVLTYVSRPEVMEAKEHSHTRKDSAWNTHEAAMWQKTAVRRGETWMPHDYTFARAVTHDQDADRGVQDLSMDPRDLGISDDEATDIVNAEVVESEK